MSDVTDSELAEGADAGTGGKKSRGRLMIIGAVAGEAHQPHFLDLPVMTVNLNTGGGAPEFLRLSIALEVRDPAKIAMIEPRLPRVLDTFQVYLRELRRADLEGSAGVYRLKEELHRRINIAVYPAAIDNVLFKEILVQ